MAGTALCYAAGNLFDQVAMTQADSFVASLIKAAFVVTCALAVLLLSSRRRALLFGARGELRKAARVYLAAGLVSEVVGTAAFFQAMKLGGINIATPMVQTWVIWAALGGVVFLKEKLRPRTAVGLLLSVGGLVALALAQQRGVAFTPDWPKAIPFGLLGAVGWAGSTVLIRKGQTEGIDRYVGMLLQFSAALVGLLLVVLLTQRGGLLLSMSSRTYGCIAVSALLSGVLGMICMYTALKLAPVNRVIPIISGYPVIAAIAGALWLGNFLSAAMIASMVFVACGVVICQTSFTFGRKRRESS